MLGTAKASSTSGSATRDPAPTPADPRESTFLRLVYAGVQVMLNPDSDDNRKAIRALLGRFRRGEVSIGLEGGRVMYADLPREMKDRFNMEYVLAQHEDYLKRVGTSAPTLRGLWELVGTLDSVTDRVVPWPEGSRLGSVREYLWFFEDGMLLFGKFRVDADVTFEATTRRFICRNGEEKILRGTWRIRDGQLFETFDGHEQHVRLRELSRDRFVVQESTPISGVFVRVVYERRLQG